MLLFCVSADTYRTYTFFLAWRLNHDIHVLFNVLRLVNGFNQSTLQRLSAMKTLRKAKLAHILNFPIVVFYNIILVIVGNIVYAYFAWKRCDPFEV